MSATLGSLALAGVMQSTGAVATETVGNVIFVDFVAGTIIPEYAAATGTTAAAVEASIASGVTIGTGGLILIGAAALAIIAAIIIWWVSTHKELETAETPQVIAISGNWGELKFAQLYGNNYMSYPRYGWQFNVVNRGTPFTNTVGDIVKINDNLFLKCSQLGWYDFVKADGSKLPQYSSLYPNTALYFNKNGGDHENIDVTAENPCYVGLWTTKDQPTSNGTAKTFWRGKSGNYYEGEYYGNGPFTNITEDLVTFCNNQSGISTPMGQGNLSQKRKQNAVEIPTINPDQELSINTGASTLEIPNPNLDEIANHMNEQVNNPDSNPEKGYNYQPEFTIQEKLDPVPTPTPIPVPPPAPAPDIPTEPVVPPTLPVLGSNSSGMVRLWNPTAEEMGAISQFMLSGDFIDQVVKLFADPADYLLSLSLQPIVPSVSAKESIYIGSLPVPNITVSPVTSQYATVDFGSVEIPAMYNSFVDYDTQFSIFLPFIGEQPLNTQDMIGSTIHLQYNVDVLTGTFAAMLRVTRSTNGVDLDAVLYQWQGNLAAQIPIRASSWNVGITDIAAGALAGASGGPYGAIAGAGVALGKGLLKPRISGSGSLSGNAGLLGIQYPYLIINRPRTATPSNYKFYSGVSTSEVSRLGDLSGYTMIQDTHLQGIPATSVELDEILSLLKGGVIL